MTRLLSAVALAALSAVPAAADNLAVRFNNYSSDTVYRIYSSPTHEGSWRQDLLGSDVLRPGQGLDVLFANVGNCYYDVMVEFASGYSFTDTWNICAAAYYDIY